MQVNGLTLQDESSCLCFDCIFSSIVDDCKSYESIDHISEKKTGEKSELTYKLKKDNKLYRELLDFEKINYIDIIIDYLIENKVEDEADDDSDDRNNDVEDKNEKEEGENNDVEEDVKEDYDVEEDVKEDDDVEEDNDTTKTADFDNLPKFHTYTSTITYKTCVPITNTFEETSMNLITTHISIDNECVSIKLLTTWGVIFEVETETETFTKSKYIVLTTTISETETVTFTKTVYYIDHTTLTETDIQLQTKLKYKQDIIELTETEVEETTFTISMGKYTETDYIKEYKTDTDIITEKTKSFKVLKTTTTELVDGAKTSVTQTTTSISTYTAISTSIFTTTTTKTKVKKEKVIKKKWKPKTLVRRVTVTTTITTTVTSTSVSLSIPAIITDLRFNVLNIKNDGIPIGILNNSLFLPAVKEDQKNVANNQSNDSNKQFFSNHYEQMEYLKLINETEFLISSQASKLNLKLILLSAIIATITSLFIFWFPQNR